MNNFMNYLRLFHTEWATLREFSNEEHYANRRLVFYSEHAAYGKFFMPILEALRGEPPFSFLSSDPADPILKFAPDQIKAFYIKNLLGGLLPQLDACAIVMTMPDLEQYHIKRSQKSAEHIYFFHALVSTHMIYRKGALDYYDTILCAGPHHVAEIRQREKVYGLKPKRLIAAGYPLLDKIYADYRCFALKRNRKPGGEIPTVLIAPSWAPQNIMLSCLEPLVKNLKTSGFHVLIRPHPEFIKRYPKELARLQKNPDFNENVEFEIFPRKENSLFEADILVTDWSGIAFEYAFGTERPVLFIDTPRKVFNQEYEKLGIDPIEVSLRSQIGVHIQPKAIGTAAKIVAELISDQMRFRANILRLREEVVFNFGHSAGVIADFLSPYRAA